VIRGIHMSQIIKIDSENLEEIIKISEELKKYIDSFVESIKNDDDLAEDVIDGGENG
jgi:hypothetical protein